MRRINAGFTLIELLVTVALLGVLVALLLPAVQSARAASRRATCLNHLHQLALAAQQYHAVHEEFPSGLDQKEVKWSPRFRGTSLFTFLLPHLEQGSVLSRWNYEAPLSNTEGGATALSATVLETLICPADTLPAPTVEVAGRHYGMTSYGGNGGGRSYEASEASLDGVFHTTGPASEPEPDQQPVRLEMITDGSSQTFLFGERNHDDPNLESFVPVYWAESLEYLGRWAAIGGRKRIGDVTLSALVPINYQTPFDYANRRQADPPIENQLDFQIYQQRRTCAHGSQHAGGANFALADGSARFVNDAVPITTLQLLCSRNDGELNTP